jgi:hypothetical protein
MSDRSRGSCVRFACRHLALSGKLIVAALVYVDLMADSMRSLAAAFNIRLAYEAEAHESHVSTRATRRPRTHSRGGPKRWPASNG